jgi:hypothetical protein
MEVSVEVVGRWQESILRYIVIRDIYCLRHHRIGW